MLKTTTPPTMDSNRAKQAELALRRAMQEKGLPLGKLPWLMAMVAHETGGFNSHVEDTNNLSGIKFVKGNRWGAIKGRLSPEGDYYAAYPGGVLYWARHYLYEVTKKSNPFAAPTESEFVHRLKQNGYFGATESAYLKALQSWRGQITRFLQMNWPTVAATGGTLLLLAVIVFIIYND